MEYQVASELAPVFPFGEIIDPPREVDTVVIGGGITGVMTTLELAERGISVALCEKGIIAGEQSSRNSGWIRELQRNERLIPLCTRSIELWSRMNERIGHDTGWRRTGITHLAYNSGEMDIIKDYLKIGRRFDLDIRLLNPEQIDHNIPGSKPPIFSALYARNGGRAEPWVTVPKMAESARKLGAHIAIKCAVRSIETAAGRVYSVITERGEIRCSNVVLAVGAWTHMFAGHFGINIPQINEIRTIAHVNGVENLAYSPVRAHNFAFRKRLDGSFTVSISNKKSPSLIQNFSRYPFDLFRDLFASWQDMDQRVNQNLLNEVQMLSDWKADSMTPFEKIRVMSPAPNNSLIRSAFRYLSETFPDFASARITGKWSGMLTSSPDGLPVLSPSHAIPGLFIACGLSNIGFGAGPAVGELMADLVSGSTPHVEPEFFDISRITAKLSL